MMIGAVGIGLPTTLFGSRPSIAKAMAFGMMFGHRPRGRGGHLDVNQVQTVNTLYTSTPEWNWFVAHAMFGATVGLVGASRRHCASACES